MSEIIISDAPRRSSGVPSLEVGDLMAGIPIVVNDVISFTVDDTLPPPPGMLNLTPGIPIVVNEMMTITVDDTLPVPDDDDPPVTGRTTYITVSI